jgi:RHS repeat-associated protein
VRVAMQRGGEGVKLILGDHLGSTSVVLNADGSSLGSQGYDAWGLPRFTTGTLPTKYTFTGQYSHVAGFGLMFYQARWYSPELGRFGQADSIIPEASQGTIAWDRYAGMNNNPVRWIDPSGHRLDDGCLTEGCASDEMRVYIPPSIKTHSDIVRYIWEFIKKNPNLVLLNLTSTLHVLIPGGFGLESGLVSVPLRINIRTPGRMIGEDMFGPALLLLGYALTIAPELLSDLAKGASGYEITIDLLVDTEGFIYSEIAGDVAGIVVAAFGLRFLGPPGAFVLGLGWNFAADSYVGNNWDSTYDSYQRYKLAQQLETNVNLAVDIFSWWFWGMGIQQPVPQPVPTPPVQQPIAY